jgi:hypothetical protein
MTSTEDLNGEELLALFTRVFAPGPEDRALAVLVDLPDEKRPDTAAWKERRTMAARWVSDLLCLQDRLGVRVHLCAYRNVGANNADLPAMASMHDPAELPASASGVGFAQEVPLEKVLAEHRLLVAVTEYSATAPLKLAAPRFGFRAATMPGFSPKMIPALRLDYEEIGRRVGALKALLDEAEGAALVFRVEGMGQYELALDLRHRTAHASTGLLREPGTAGNLPSGEAYIVPYEGEMAGDPSCSAGQLPVQIDEEIVVFEIEEKLGLHIAFGRSDHFGGQVGAAQFSRPEEVVHLDRVYVPAMQPKICVARADLRLPSRRLVPLIRNDRYVL